MGVEGCGGSGGGCIVKGADGLELFIELVHCFKKRLVVFCGWLRT